MSNIPNTVPSSRATKGLRILGKADYLILSERERERVEEGGSEIDGGCYVGQDRFEAVRGMI